MFIRTVWRVAERWGEEERNKEREGEGERERTQCPMLRAQTGIAISLKGVGEGVDIRRWVCKGPGNWGCRALSPLELKCPCIPGKC